MAETLTGGCLCGAVRYQITADPLMAGHCHCLSCRSLSGAGHSTLAAFPAHAVEFTGEVKGYDWIADSGANVTSQFCPNCGSPLFGLNDRMEGLVAVRLGSLDDPDRVAPQMEIYTDRLLEWDRLADGLPAFPGMPPLG